MLKTGFSDIFRTLKPVIDDATVRERKTELSITTLAFMRNRFSKNKRMVVERILTDSSLSYITKRQI
tara:strand:- start:101153 stop:101353 length:201 start_codon:yes stop_codon:yes gene_type:complete